MHETFFPLDHTLLDTSRATRCGRPETIYCPGKTPTQVAEIALALLQKHGAFLATRADPEQALAVRTALETNATPLLPSPAPPLQHCPHSGLLRCGQLTPPATHLRPAVITAGTADQGPAHEALGTLQFFGYHPAFFPDCGVAGLHRLLAHLEAIRACHVLIVAAGFEGALPSVVGGLVHRPVIALPTSTSPVPQWGGIPALLAMLQSCAAGITVVNIDNGFGAASAADAILRLTTEAAPTPSNEPSPPVSACC